jgi:lactoylglutathione lyase
MKLGYVIIYVPNVAETVQFYEKAFGLTKRFVDETGNYAEMETGQTALAFASEELVSKTCHQFVPNRKTNSPAGAEVGFVVEDVASSFKAAVKSGAVPVVEPMKKPWGQTVSYVRDNNGFLVELCSEVTG